MAWLELKLAVAEHAAVRAMQREAEQAAADAAAIRELARKRVTRPLHTWGEAARSTWRAHAEIQRSLKALRAEALRNPRCNKRVEHRRAAPLSVASERTTCPICERVPQ